MEISVEDLDGKEREREGRNVGNLPYDGPIAKVSLITCPRVYQHSVDGFPLGSEIKTLGHTLHLRNMDYALMMLVFDFVLLVVTNLTTGLTTFFTEPALRTLLWTEAALIWFYVLSLMMFRMIGYIADRLATMTLCIICQTSFLCLLKVSGASSAEKW